MLLPASPRRGCICWLKWLPLVATSWYLSALAGAVTHGVGLPHPPKPDVRDVRVLIASSAARVRVRAEGRLTITGANQELFATGSGTKWLTFSAGSDGLRFGGDSSPSPAVTLTPPEGGVLEFSAYRGDAWLPTVDYPGRLRLRAVEGGLIQVINEVDVETYVGCVVVGEVWPDFAEEAYRAQAVMARTFVLYQMSRREQAAYDVTATESSQVYRGLRTGRSQEAARKAAAYTAGVVVTRRDGSRDELFPTYYHSACGGVTAPLEVFGPVEPLTALGGGVVCDYCKIAPGNTYRWGPVTLPNSEVLAKLVRVERRLESSETLVNIEIVKRAQGRALRLRMTDQAGQTIEMAAERFRLALGSRVIRSTWFDVSIEEDEVRFENGRGFGHGVGLCQWGMQGQALKGKQAAQILRFYYPNARITRVY